VKDSRTTYPRLGLLVISDQHAKLKKISNLFVGLAEYSVISMKGVKVTLLIG
jgi:hypothetical protein